MHWGAEDSSTGFFSMMKKKKGKKKTKISVQIMIFSNHIFKRLLKSYPSLLRISDLQGTYFTLCVIKRLFYLVSEIRTT